MGNSLEHKTRIFVQCLNSLRKPPLKIWHSILLSALILSMPVGLYMMGTTLEYFSFLVKQQPEITAFLSEDVEHNSAVLMQQKIQEMEEIESSQFISAEQALKEFEELTGLYSVMNYLQENPFPISIRAQVSAAYINPQDYETLLSQIQRLEYVDLVQFDYEWAAKLSSLRNVVENFGKAVFIPFSLVVFFLIISMSRRHVFFSLDEIKLLSLIGASRRFIYRPFIYTAFIQSFLIFILTFVIVESSLAYSAQSVSDLISLYQIDSPATATQWKAWGIIFSALLLIHIISVRLTVALQLRKLEFVKHA